MWTVQSVCMYTGALYLCTEKYHILFCVQICYLFEEGCLESILTAILKPVNTVTVLFNHDNKLFVKYKF
jgi:hypothetical protein